jgi:ubiquinone/menaquinone biosynthesis C-methylase UbiE
MIAEAVGPRGEVLAADLSQNMVDMTAHRCATEGLAWVKTARMNAENPTVEPEYFRRGRAVRPGGRVVATV